MKKILVSIVALMLLVISLVAATPADTIKEGTPNHRVTGDGGIQQHVDNQFGLNHCVLKPMYLKNGELRNQPNGWVAFGPFWMQCNGFGPQE